MKDLTDRQREMLTHIGEAIRRTGMPPTVRELARLMNITSTNGITDHLRALERKGFIDRHDMLSRGITLTKKGLALVGGVAEPPNPGVDALKERIVDEAIHYLKVPGNTDLAPLVAAVDAYLIATSKAVA